MMRERLLFPAGGYRISAGKSREKIANEMFIDVETVKSHLKNIYFKLDVHSKAEAIRLAKKKRFI
jgi:DNA-binding CsgD family transcriptional regulator